MYVLIVGGGKVGSHLASLLLEQGHRVRVVDNRERVIERLREELPADSLAVSDGSDPEVLDAQKAGEADVLAAVTGDDEANLVITTLGRQEYRIPRTIARVNNPKNAWLFTPEMGVDVALNQADLIAHLIAEEMSLGDMMTLLKLRKGVYSLIEQKIDPASPAAGKIISELSLPKECTLVAIIRSGELIIPRGNSVLLADDEVLALVHRQRLAALAAILSGGAT
ncbi:MAG TPA: TrkA family potassium uptake protein [Promineifilum sp.]